MMYNIKTGHNGIQRRASEDIVILVTSLHKLRTLSIPFVFSDRHAYLKLARFSNKISDLDQIDWISLQARNFRKDDVDRFERYQAEALVYKYMPISALLGIACYNDTVKAQVEAKAATLSLAVKVSVLRRWYL